MRKIPTLFVRDEKTFRVTPEVQADCQWVLNGIGVATYKWDGSCCAVIGGKLYQRYIADEAPTPEEAAIIGFIPINDDGKEGHRHGWVPIGNHYSEKFYREAWAWQMRTMGQPADGTYELVGPKINGNPHAVPYHVLMPHGTSEFPDAPRTFDGLREWLTDNVVEGIVWWYEAGNINMPLAKLKRKDFGLPWPVKRGR